MCLNLHLAVLTVFENQHRLYKQISKMSLKLITRSYVCIIIASCNQINCNNACEYHELAHKFLASPNKWF